MDGKDKEKWSQDQKNMFGELLLETLLTHHNLTNKNLTTNLLYFVDIVKNIEWAEYKYYQILIHLDLNNYFGTNSKIFNDKIDLIVFECNKLTKEELISRVNNIMSENKSVWPEYNQYKNNILPIEEECIRNFYQFHFNFYYTLFLDSNKYLTQNKYRLLNYTPIDTVDSLNSNSKIVLYLLFLDEYTKKHKVPTLSFYTIV